VAKLPDILTVEELAELVRVKPVTIYRLVRRDEIPHFRVGRTIRFRRDDVERIVDTSARQHRKKPRGKK